MAARIYNYVSMDLESELSQLRHVHINIIYMRLDLVQALSRIIVTHMDALKSTLDKWQWYSEFAPQEAHEAGTVSRMIERWTGEMLAIAEKFAVDWITTTAPDEAGLAAAYPQLANLPFTSEINKLLSRLVKSDKPGMRTLSSSIRADFDTMSRDLIEILDMRRRDNWFSNMRDLPYIASQIRQRDQFAPPQI